MAREFTQDFKRNFIRGLAAMLPTILTLMIIIFVLQFIQRYVGQYLNVAAQWVAVQFWSLSTGREFSWQGHSSQWATVKRFWDSNHLHLLGIVLALVAIYVLGRFVASWLGRRIWRHLDVTLCRLPFIRHIYPQVKQVTDYLFSDRGVHFSRVVALEYPRKGMWSLGLVTAPGLRDLEVDLDQEMLTVFIPSSPTPMTGYTVTVLKHEVIDMPLTIDEALRYTMSGGVIHPPDQRSRKADAEETRKSRLLPHNGEEHK